MTDPLEEFKDTNLEQVIWDELVEEIREKYRASWEKSIEEFEEFCRNQDEEFECAIKYGYFLPRFSIEKILVKAKPRKLIAKYSLEVNDDSKYILLHPDISKSLYESIRKTQYDSFFGKLKLGFQCLYWSYQDWLNVMVDEDFTKEFFDYLGYSEDL